MSYIKHRNRFKFIRRNQLNLRRKNAIFTVRFENVPNFTEISQREFEKFTKISQALPKIILRC